MVEPAPVPGFGAIAGHVVIVADEVPAGEVLEERALVLVEDRDVHVVMRARLTPQPRVDGPAPAQGPGPRERRHQPGDAGDRLGRVLGRGHSRPLQPNVEKDATPWWPGGPGTILACRFRTPIGTPFARRSWDRRHLRDSGLEFLTRESSAGEARPRRLAMKSVLRGTAL